MTGVEPGSGRLEAAVEARSDICRDGRLFETVLWIIFQPLKFGSVAVLPSAFVEL